MRISNLETRRVLETEHSTPAWTTHLMHECCDTRHYAAQLWLDGCLWEVNDRVSYGGVKLQSTPVSPMYSCLLRLDGRRLSSRAQQ